MLTMMEMFKIKLKVILCIDKFNRTVKHDVISKITVVIIYKLLKFVNK